MTAIKADFLKTIFFPLAGLVILVILIAKIGPHQIIKIVSGTNPIFLLSGILVYLFLIFIRSLKWFLMIKEVKKELKFQDFLPPYFLNCLIGNLTPFKSGELATPFVLNKYLNLPAGRGLSIIVIDRFFELFYFFLILLAGTFYIIKSKILTGSILAAFEGSLVILFLANIFLATIIFGKKSFLILIKNLLSRLGQISALEKITDFLLDKINVFYKSISDFKNKRIYWLLTLLTVFGWFLEFLSFYLVIRSVMPVLFFQAVMAQLIAIAATIATFLPFGAGEIGVIYILQLFGYSQALSASGALLARIFLTGSQFFLGFIGILILKRKK